MDKYLNFLKSTVGRKYAMGISGLCLVLFSIGHLAGNLQLFQPSGDLFNLYAHKLHSLGPLVYIIEIGLTAVFLIHIWYGFVVRLESQSSRAIGYSQEHTKGGVSRSNISSKNMLIIGIGLLVFLILHLWNFRFGPGIEEYSTEINGEKVWDLQKRVIDVLSNPMWCLFYLVSMVLLGFHLRHGVWSAFQSIGLMSGRWTPIVYTLGTVLGILVALGFFLLPLWIFIDPLGVYK